MRGAQQREAGWRRPSSTTGVMRPLAKNRSAVPRSLLRHLWPRHARARRHRRGSSLSEAADDPPDACALPHWERRTTAKNVQRLCLVCSEAAPITNNRLRPCSRAPSNPIGGGRTCSRAQLNPNGGVRTRSGAPLEPVRALRPRSGAPLEPVRALRPRSGARACGKIADLRCSGADRNPKFAQSASSGARILSPSSEAQREEACRARARDPEAHRQALARWPIERTRGEQPIGSAQPYPFSLVVDLEHQR
jgi:hypothetical protein